MPTNQPSEFSAVRVRLASPETILSWSHGEVTKPETINYRTQRPEKDGLFDEKIFGPVKDWECYCGKYKRIRYKGIVCDKCGVEVTRSIVRRERMGHIQLASPVSHIWFVRGVPSRIGLVLDLSPQELEKIIYFASYVIIHVDNDSRIKTIEQIDKEFKAKQREITDRYDSLLQMAKSAKGQKENKDKDPDVLVAQIETEVNRLRDNQAEEIGKLEKIRDMARSELKSIKKFKIISELQYRDLSLKYGPVFQASIGAEALFNLVKEVNLEEVLKELQANLVDAEGNSKRKLLKRIKLIQNMIINNLRPEWMFLTSLPVIPPDLRPMVQLDGGRFAASDLNDLYRRVINRNNRLKKLLEIGAPEVIVRNEKRMLQEAVDALLDNSIRHGKEVTASTGQRRKLRSLADMLRGKQGRFRQNLLGKRVDYSGRSVIVVGPTLKLSQCGLPKKMALELFKPFVISKLISREHAHNVRSANKLIEQGRDEVYDILEETIKTRYVLLNRAPTLHRLGFQAFQPVLIEGKAIQVHPLVCAAFNADFDGDQMAVHVPLTDAAQEEARTIMLSSVNLLKPASGEPIMGPTHDMILGCYYMSQTQEGLKGEGKIFGSFEEANLAYSLGIIHLRAKIKVRMDGKLEETCIGRIIINQLFPEDFGFVNQTFDKKLLKKVIQEHYQKYGIEKNAQLLDDIKRVGFEFSTKSGISWGMDDLTVPEQKHVLVAEADAAVNKTYQDFQEGLLTENERYNRVIEIWAEVRDKIGIEVNKTLNPYDVVSTFVLSGARGSMSQVAQMSGMKGLVVNPAGEVIELPAKDSFKEGLNVLEYFISTHGSRKGMTDTALRTADAGYLTRRLIDVAQDVVINTLDCGAKDGRILTRDRTDKQGRAFTDAVIGRYVISEVKDETTGEVIVKKGQLIDTKLAEKIDKSNVSSVNVRTVMRCLLPRGACIKCYGIDLGFNIIVKKGTAVGIIAAQAIGEPGTQLTMRTFHTGGVAGRDITQGLPRVEELFEARPPKGQAVVAESSGQVSIQQSSSKEISLKIIGEAALQDDYKLGESKIDLKDGDKVEKGDVLFMNEKNKAVKVKNDGVVKIQEGSKNIVVQRESENIEEHIIPSGFGLLVKDGDLVEKGQPLTEGNLDLQQMMHLRGPEEAKEYIIEQVQEIYHSQGQSIHDKHLEVIVKQMFSKVRVLDSGDASYIVGELQDKNTLTIQNAELEKDNKTQATYEQVLLGITKASLSTESFLAAASFQETTKVLIEAAVSGKRDELRGLKENVIIGKLIPAGTGFASHELQKEKDEASKERREAFSAKVQKEPG
ncbi:MAG: DNA-directed RNA polymerase subunit beta' [Candidatus Doudnabacteria bacterium CG10_big_fil_rev_8_21_14_0_10_41_10]|uniref:DNA-directed RNA polymerase subunit beta' n=1 Tax=Candidatus Doudnabacteria bacterium CG10_big_fil_rev_8_21_14_0_10_41_10 TaxID=1974551 RepID=A0A2H0VDV2_9BACT|nr:MAG: DNA-directed RNA polymerase subunit beta' [Candidatus Doudnabacteria bacterium CG10_big_fil_rev_8_21_14_0_10_41_10]